MRSKLALALAVIGLLASSMAPANAIFGLSKCEKVKKEVITLEKQYFEARAKLRGSEYTYKIYDNTFTFFIPTEKSVLMIDKLITNDPLPKIWKIGTNNPKCFTNTQNMQIMKMQRDTIGLYLNHGSRPKYRNYEPCISLMSKYGTEPKMDADTLKKCFIKYVRSIEPDITYKSIYNY